MRIVVGSTKVKRGSQMQKFKKGDIILTTFNNEDYLGVVDDILIPGVYQVTLDKECPKEYAYPPSKHVILIEKHMEKVKTI